MATGSVHGVLDHVRRAALREQDAGLTDGEWLTRYLARRDGAAFEALVRRHGRLRSAGCPRSQRCEGCLPSDVRGSVSRGKKTCPIVPLVILREILAVHKQEIGSGIRPLTAPSQSV